MKGSPEVIRLLVEKGAQARGRGISLPPRAFILDPYPRSWDLDELLPVYQTLILLIL